MFSVVNPAQYLSGANEYEAYRKLLALTDGPYWFDGQSKIVCSCSLDIW